MHQQDTHIVARLDIAVPPELASVDVQVPRSLGVHSAGRIRLLRRRRTCTFEHGHESLWFVLWVQIVGLHASRPCSAGGDRRTERDEDVALDGSRETSKEHIIDVVSDEAAYMRLSLRIRVFGTKGIDALDSSRRTSNMGGLVTEPLLELLDKSLVAHAGRIVWV